MLITKLRYGLKNTRGQITFDMFKKDVLFIDDESQRLELEKRTENYLKDNVREVIPKAAEVKSIKSQMQLDMGIDDKPKYDDQKVMNMILDNKLTHLMIKLYNSSKNNSKEEN